MDPVFDSIGDVKTGRESWRLRVRVLRLWKVPSFRNPEQAISLEMVLVDEKGVKIHATIKKQLLYLFQDKIVEGEVYKMTNFEVARNTGSYRTAVHEFKLNFLMRTKVQRAGALVISQNGFSFSKCSQIKSVKEEAVHLVDIIGLLSGVSAEKEYRRDGKIVKMVIIEITDDSGKVDCALFGEYVDILRKEMEKSGGGMPVIVVQFAKIKIFRENGSLQNVMNTTRLFVNPDFAEAVEFKEGLAVHGVESTCPIAVIQPRARISKEDDFLHMFPKKSIDGVKHCLEEGVFVVCGTIAGLVDGSDFSYLACKCHRKVVPDSGSYYCSNCDKHVYQVLPRFKVKVNVKDDVEECVLVLFDYDVHYLLGKTCVQVIEETKSGCGSGYPVELDALVGKRLLFKVERNLSSFSALDDSFKVKRVCDDLNIIQSFIQNGDNHTPAKSVATLPGELFSLSGVQSDPAGQSFVSDAIVTPDEIMANHGGEYSSLLGEKSGHGFESNVEDFVVDAIVTPPAVVNADIPLKFEKSKFTLGDDSDAVPLSFSDVAAPCVGDEIPRIADEGTIGLKRKLFSEFEELDDLDVKMPFKCVKIEKE